MQKFNMNLLVIMAATSGILSAQDNEWETQKQITGYINTEVNYFPDLKGYPRKYAMSLTEAGILVGYQPLRNVSFKTVFVYRPDLSFDQMLNEANVEYKANDYLNIKLGRFLTPLSPMNTFYYAPVNISATLPMITSFHESFPLNMDALSLNGSVGEDFKFGYDVFAGGHKNSLYLNTGALGFFSTENSYFTDLKGGGYTVDLSNFNSAMAFGGGVHVQCSYKDYITFGANYFIDAKDSIDVYVPQFNVSVTMPLERKVYGFNLKLKYETLQLVGEYWDNDLKVDSTAVKNKGAFVILSNTFGKITPYIRIENQHTYDMEYNRYTGGINYKPSFETAFKLEYMHYQYKSYELNGLVGAFIYSF